MWIQEKKISRYVSVLWHLIWLHPKYLIIINTFSSLHSTFTNAVSLPPPNSTLWWAIIEMPNMCLVYATICKHSLSLSLSLPLVPAFPDMSSCNLYSSNPLLYFPTPLSNYPLLGFCTEHHPCLVNLENFWLSINPHSGKEWLSSSSLCGEGRGEEVRVCP